MLRLLSIIDHKLAHLNAVSHREYRGKVEDESGEELAPAEGCFVLLCENIPKVVTLQYYEAEDHLHAEEEDGFEVVFCHILSGQVELLLVFRDHRVKRA